MNDHFVTFIACSYKDGKIAELCLEAESLWIMVEVIIFI